MGQPVDDEGRKVDSMKFKSKVLNIAASVLLVVVSAPTVWHGPSGKENEQAAGCSGYLYRTIFSWMCVFGLLVASAEFGLGFIQDYVHVLNFRSGRACVLLFVGSVSLSAGPSEVPLSYVSQNGASQGRVLLTMHWRFVGCGLLLLAAAFYALRVSARAKWHEMKGSSTNKADGHPASSGASML